MTTTDSVNDETMRDATALKPCPFCGSARLRIRCIALPARDEYGHHVDCEDCGASSREAPRRVVPTYWNRRASVGGGSTSAAGAASAPEGLSDHEALARVLADHGCMDWDKLHTTNGGGELLDELYEQARVILAAGFRRPAAAQADAVVPLAPAALAPEGFDALQRTVADIVCDAAERHWQDVLKAATQIIGVVRAFDALAAAQAAQGAGQSGAALPAPEGIDALPEAERVYQALLGMVLCAREKCEPHATLLEADAALIAFRAARSRRTASVEADPSRSLRSLAPEGADARWVYLLRKNREPVMAFATYSECQRALSEAHAATPRGDPVMYDTTSCEVAAPLAASAPALPEGILPCPFCRGATLKTELADSPEPCDCWVWCQCCQALGPSRPTFAEAEAAWNARAQPAAHRPEGFMAWQLDGQAAMARLVDDVRKFRAAENTVDQELWERQMGVHLREYDAACAIGAGQSSAPPPARPDGTAP